MTTKTIYTNNPRCFKKQYYLNDAGERDAVSVCSRMDDMEAENYYIYKQGKRELARRVEHRNDKTTEFLYHVLTGEPTKIVETYHPAGKTVSVCTYDKDWNEIGFEWID